jgi:hypothetical protein
MNEIKVYVSLKEAEELIFNRCLILREGRFDIARAQGLLSICLFLNGNMLSNHGENKLILFTAINYFEIPENDENLFINHYRIPLGLVKTSGRKVRDVSKNEMTIDDYGYKFDGYVELRNGLLSILQKIYEKTTNLQYRETSINTLNEFNVLSEIKRKLLIELLKDTKFPTLAVKVDKFVSDNFFRVTWWGKFVVDNYLPKLNIDGEEKIIAIRKWLRSFLKFNDFDVLNKNINTIPEELKNEIDFLLGYYLASFYKESFDTEKKFLDDLYNLIHYENKDVVFSWISFFNSFYMDNTKTAYFVKALREDVLKIEKVAFELSINKLEIEIDNNYDFILNKIDESQLISEYLELKHGVSDKNPILIKKTEAKRVFKNNFFDEELIKVGFDLNSQYDRNNKIQNSCWFSKREFHLNLRTDTDSSNVTFYIDENSLATDKLKQLKIKTKPVKKLLNNSKKILIGFNRLEEVPNLCNLYSSFLKDEIKEKCDKVVFILLVDLDVEEIQSMKFSKHIKTQKSDLFRLFNTEVDLIIKNDQTINDAEIKRNLKNILEGYKINQIEVIDENFDNEKASWLLESNTEYLIEDKNINYHYILE